MVQRGIFSRLLMDDGPDCLAHGTLIRIADGTDKKVEDLVPATPSNPVGDVLLADDGTKVYVVALVCGPQLVNWPMVGIVAESSNGDQRYVHSINVCAGHNFLRGYTRTVRASLLRAGDHIQSEFGEAVVRSVDFVPYGEDPVWDFYLASESFVKSFMQEAKGNLHEYFKWLFFACRSSLFGLTPKQHLLLANGLLVGDLCIQNQVREAERMGQDINVFG